MTVATDTFVTLDEIRAARERIEAAARYTPLIDVPWPTGAPAGSLASPQARTPVRPLYLKCENLQPMGAFKIRGAFNMIAQLPKEQLARGVITYSSGNHGQAVALA
ncbi:MAG TPA: pyridoxal-phosphate dependent enzyme, partial [Vicinamibacterales bacterium]